MGSIQTFSGGFVRFGGWGCKDWAIWEDLSLEEYVMKEEKFNEKGMGFSSITIKKHEKINMKKFFSIESKEQHKNLKRTEIITHMRGSENNLAQ